MGPIFWAYLAVMSHPRPSAAARLLVLAGGAAIVGFFFDVDGRAHLSWVACFVGYYSSFLVCFPLALVANRVVVTLPVTAGSARAVLFGLGLAFGVLPTLGCALLWIGPGVLLDSVAQRHAGALVAGASLQALTVVANEFWAKRLGSRPDAAPTQHALPTGPTLGSWAGGGASGGTGAWPALRGLMAAGRPTAVALVAVPMWLGAVFVSSTFEGEGLAADVAPWLGVPISLAVVAAGWSLRWASTSALAALPVRTMHWAAAWYLEGVLRMTIGLSLGLVGIAAWSAISGDVGRGDDYASLLVWFPAWASFGGASALALGGPRRGAGVMALVLACGALPMGANTLSFGFRILGDTTFAPLFELVGSAAGVGVLSFTCSLVAAWVFVTGLRRRE